MRKCSDGTEAFWAHIDLESLGCGSHASGNLNDMV